MADMLSMAADQIRDPVSVLILMKPDDFSFHYHARGQPLPSDIPHHVTTANNFIMTG